MRRTSTPGRRSNGFWYRLTTAEQDLVESMAKKMAYDSGATLIHASAPGHWAAVLLSGRVSVLDATGTRILATRSTGDVVGEQALLDNGVRSATVTALTPVRALVLGREVFEPLLDRHPRILRVLSAVVSERLRQADGALMGERDPATAKVVGHLVRACAAAMPGNGVPVHIGSQALLATELRMSLATLGRVLRQLRDQEILTTHRAIVVVRDLQKLRAYAPGNGTAGERLT